MSDDLRLLIDGMAPEEKILVLEYFAGTDPDGLREAAREARERYERADGYRSPVADLTACVFCDILAGEAPATIIRTWSTAIAIKPLNPVTEGHTLVIPATHVRDVAEDPEVSAMTMEAAAEYAAEVGPCNVITSAGREATQTVFHLHIHVVPRRDGDGLALPWAPNTSQERAEQAEAAIARVREMASNARGSLGAGCTCRQCEDDESDPCDNFGRWIAWNLDPAAVLAALDGQEGSHG